MSQTLTIPDDLAERARRHGVSIENLLRAWPRDTSADKRAEHETGMELRARQDAVQRSITLYEHLAARYGAFPDSTDLRPLRREGVRLPWLVLSSGNNKWRASGERRRGFPMESLSLRYPPNVSQSLGAPERW